MYREGNSEGTRTVHIYLSEGIRFAIRVCAVTHRGKDGRFLTNLKFLSTTPAQSRQLKT